MTGSVFTQREFVCLRGRMKRSRTVSFRITIFLLEQKTLKIVVVVVGDSDGKALVTSDKTIGIEILNSKLII